MAEIVYSGSGGSFTTATNMRGLYIEYTPADPIEVNPGANYALAPFISADAKISLNFQSQMGGGGRGTKIIANNFKLLHLAAICGLKKTNQVQVYLNQDDDKLNMVKVAFHVDLFDECRLFGSGDLLQGIVSLPSGASVVIRAIDSPFQNPNASAKQYNTQTVLANNTQSIPPDMPVIYLPNNVNTPDSQDWTFQAVGNAMARWQKQDFYASLSDDWVSNVTPYPLSDLLGLEMRGLQAQIIAGASNLEYLTIT